MPNYLDDQLSAFKTSVSSSSSKLANKRTVAAPTSRTATPPQSSQSYKGDLKRKRPEENVTYSQPQDTGTGNNIMTMVTYVVTMLKEKKDTPKTLTDIVSYLSMQHLGEDFRRLLSTILMNHDRIQYERKDDGGEGTFKFRPMHDIDSKDTLLAYLQSRRTAQGLNVRELRDGWLDANDAIDELEMEGKLLVIRNKKENKPKLVWVDDPSLSYDIDDEFKAIWKTIKLPEPKVLADELEKVGLTPANKSRNVKKPLKQETKKSKKPRRGGKTTNTHMAGVLRDYSHLKK